jgi:hypothetical protein
MKTQGRRQRIPSIKYAIVKEHRETPVRPKLWVRRGRRLVGAVPSCVNAITAPTPIFSKCVQPIENMERYPGISGIQRLHRAATAAVRGENLQPAQVRLATQQIQTDRLEMGPPAL